MRLNFDLRNRCYVTARYVTYVTQGEDDSILRQKSELSFIQKELKSVNKEDCSRMIVVNGRRRIGKTRLIEQALSGKGENVVFPLIHEKPY